MRALVDVKICGLTTADDAKAALDLGADYLGFIFHPRSPRYLNPAAVGRIVASLPAAAKCVGVFVNEPADSVLRIVRDNGLAVAQIHGDEPAGDFGGCPFPIWRAVWLRDKQWMPVPSTWPADRYIVDAAEKGVYGGSGIVADWPRAAELAAEHSVMLAGGLTPENVAEALRIVRPAGVDVVTGVEAAPGKKDLKKLEAFIRKVRQNE